MLTRIGPTLAALDEYIIPSTALERRLLLECIAHRLVHTSREAWYWSLSPAVAMGQRGFSEDGSLPGLVTFAPAADAECPGCSVILHVRFRALWRHNAIEVEWRLVEDEAARLACESVSQHSWTRNPPKLRYELRKALRAGAPVDEE